MLLKFLSVGKVCVFGPGMLRCVLLLSLCAAAAGRDCDWLRHFSERTRACLRDLHHMGGRVNMSADVPFPNRFYRSIQDQNVDSQLAFVQENLQHIFHLYRHGNMSEVDWDVERFLSTLHSQVSRLRPCVSTAQSKNETLSAYYRRLLMSTDGSLASWQRINHITRLHLFRLDLLVQSIRSRTAPGRTARGRHNLDRRH